ncbi:MAG: hypothetical protein JSW08_02005 [archaeon]|nr:MAG: hypothetical protein JSW08_02005 [archaeon]
MAEDYTDEEILEALQKGYPSPTEKTGIYQFFNKIIKSEDTTKVAYLDEEELRVIRTLQDASLYAKGWKLDLVNDFLKKKAEILLATSDSKNGFLIQSAITQKKNIETKSKSGGGKKTSWFKKNVEEAA